MWKRLILCLSIAGLIGLGLAGCPARPDEEPDPDDDDSALLDDDDALEDDDDSAGPDDDDSVQPDDDDALEEVDTRVAVGPAEGSAGLDPSAGFLLRFPVDAIDPSEVTVTATSSLGVQTLSLVGDKDDLSYLYAPPSSPWAEDDDIVMDLTWTPAGGEPIVRQDTVTTSVPTGQVYDLRHDAVFYELGGEGDPSLVDYVNDFIDVETMLNPLLMQFDGLDLTSPAGWSGAARGTIALQQAWGTIPLRSDVHWSSRWDTAVTSAPPDPPHEDCACDGGWIYVEGTPTRLSAPVWVDLDGDNDYEMPMILEGRDAWFCGCFADATSAQAGFDSMHVAFWLDAEGYRAFATIMGLGLFTDAIVPNVDLYGSRDCGGADQLPCTGATLSFTSAPQAVDVIRP